MCGGPNQVTQEFQEINQRDQQLGHREGLSGDQMSR